MSKEAKRIAVILFGGKGLRFGSPLPKQFVPIGDRPLLFYATKVLDESPFVEDIYVVSHPEYVDQMLSFLRQYRFKKVKAVLSGGDTRMESVFKALKFLKEGEKASDKDLILIQDGDRPSLNDRLIQRNYEVAMDFGGAVTAIPSTDSVFHSEEGERVKNYLPRKQIFLAQTPQTFPLGNLYRAYKKAFKDEEKEKYTDDASIYLEAGYRVHIVEGSVKNFKITTKRDADMFLLEAKR